MRWARPLHDALYVDNSIRSVCNPLPQGGIGVYEASSRGSPLALGSSAWDTGEVKMLVVDITAVDAAGQRLGRYKVSERRRDGSLVLLPETVEEVIEESADRPLNGDEFLDALDRLSAASSQQIA